MKKGLKVGAASLAALMVLGVAGCNKQPTEEEYAKWARDHGWIETVDMATSATEQGKGINMGAFAWTEELKKETIREFLKGDELLLPNGTKKGYNYRSMFSIATAVPTKVNGKSEVKVANTNVELVIDPNSFKLYGMGEGGTGKVNDFAVNQNVSITWLRQLNSTDSAYPKGYATEADYYHSYGIQYNGKVHVLNASSSDAEKLEVFSHYSPTIASQAAAWATYDTDAKKLAFANKVINGGGTVYYVVPESIVITAAYDSMSGSSLLKWTTEEDAKSHAKCAVYSGDISKYPFIRESYWATKLAAKNVALTADAANNYALINAAYGNWETRKVLNEAVEGVGAKGAVITDEQAATLDASKYTTQTNWARRFALDTTLTCGMMSQQTLTFNN